MNEKSEIFKNDGIKRNQLNKQGAIDGGVFLFNKNKYTYVQLDFVGIVNLIKIKGYKFVCRGVDF